MRVPKIAFWLPVAAQLLSACGGGGGGIAAPPPTQPPPAGAELAVQRVFDQLSFSAPLLLLQAPGDDSRWYVVQQDGMILSFENTAGASTTETVADLRSRVNSSASESGLLGMAFHPDFAVNDQVFLSFTETGTPFVSVIARYTVDSTSGKLDPGSETFILRVDQDASNHNGGHITFGPDRLLYAGFGDGGGAGDPNNRGQSTTNVLGAILRLDVDGTPPYEIPPGNPFAGSTECGTGFGGAPCPEIFAWGLRNPWRFSFDSQTGQLWAGDVGQNSWEEINRIEAGLNYGWRQREGAHCFNPSSNCDTANVDPVSEYGRSLGQSVTGGYVYRGSALPALVGHYLFGDFGSGRVFSIPATTTTLTDPEERIVTGLNISTFAQADDGEIYLLDYGGGGIYRIVAAP